MIDISLPLSSAFWIPSETMILVIWWYCLVYTATICQDNFLRIHLPASSL
ncbi:hypothetical protein WS1023 [Wolinella succinogenes]|uniref:Uncharacterized protein n=1 Tax=Wolinella succinogenes (strain ATCC 29543 / DSM 1740 / CCUG 13145 / JCM 31913 / LMG 7466 / NCTC 11488 / FDC 602W) TaxID=273121 RepID=Q7MRV0_WOLSU|nr:hypothetical protein WS1023 [Wolinella succinogenes]